MSELSGAKKTVTVQWTINLPMNFPEEWDKSMIEFYLNESSWCCSNLIELLENYDQKYGCICGICNAVVNEVLNEKYEDEDEYEN